MQMRILKSTRPADAWRPILLIQVVEDDQHMLALGIQCGRSLTRTGVAQARVQTGGLRRRDRTAMVV